MTDTHESMRRDMHHKAAEEFFFRQGHFLHPALIFVILVPKGNSTILMREDSAVTDGNTVRIAGKVLNHRGRILHRFLGVHVPVNAIALINDFPKGVQIGKF